MSRRRRVWMVISDDDGNPEVGYELRDMTDIECEINRDLPEYEMPTFPRSADLTITLTLECGEMTMYRPSADGWQEEQAERPGIPPAQIALPLPD